MFSVGRERVHWEEIGQTETKKKNIWMTVNKMREGKRKTERKGLQNKDVRWKLQKTGVASYS